MQLSRYYPIADTATLAERGMPVVDAARILIANGVRLLQLRHKGSFTRERYDEAARIAELCARARALFIVNDRADVALYTGAGLHVGQDDLAPEDCRRIVGSNTVVGLSTHDEAHVIDSNTEPVDYLGVGPVFATPSKQDADPVTGLDHLARVRRLTRLPLVAIGGITRARARQVLDAGADSLAVIGDAFPSPLTAETLAARTREWLAIVQE